MLPPRSVHVLLCLPHRALFSPATLAQIRRPITIARSSGSHGSRLLLRAASGLWYQLPPRIATSSSPLSDFTHSHALPARSATPNGLSDAGCEPTSSGPNASGLRP